MGLAREQSQGNLVPVGTGQRYTGRQIWLLCIAFVSTLLLIEVSDLHGFPVLPVNAVISLRCSSLSVR